VFSGWRSSQNFFAFGAVAGLAGVTAGAALFYPLIDVLFASSRDLRELVWLLAFGAVGGLLVFGLPAIVVGGMLGNLMGARPIGVLNYVGFVGAGAFLAVALSFSIGGRSDPEGLARLVAMTAPCGALAAAVALGVFSLLRGPPSDLRA